MLQGDLEQELGRRVADAVGSAFELPITPAEAVIRPTAPGRGADYQSNAAMGLARRLGRPPREVAAGIVDRLDLGEMLEPARAEGPGFVNLVIRDDWLERKEVVRLEGNTGGQFGGDVSGECRLERWEVLHD